MKILIRNSDNVVIYAQDDLVLTDNECRGNRWHDNNFNLANAVIAEATLPTDWSGATWSYLNGTWAIADQARHDAFVAGKAAIAAATQEREAVELRVAAKTERAAAVESIRVTTAAGNTFDGNEISQARMDRAVDSLNYLTKRLAAGAPITLPPASAALHRVTVAGDYEMVWVLANNAPVFVSAAELSEALVLAGAHQMAVWVI